MKISTACLVVAAGGLSAGLAASGVGAQDHAFVTDAGSKELQYTLLNQEALFGNYYSAPEPVAINRVEFAAGFGLEGSPYEVLIYNDPDNDGDPINAELISRTATTVGSQDSPVGGLFVESIDIEPVVVEGGFFVAIWIEDQLPFEGLVGVDGSWYTAPSARRLAGASGSASWAVRPPLPPPGMGGVGAFDLEELGNNLVVENTQLNWVIRAFGDDAPADLTGLSGSGEHGSPTTTPVCVADVNGDGLATPADFNAWIVAYNTGAAGCDQNGDGSCSAADFNAWIVNFNTGC